MATNKRPCLERKKKGKGIAATACARKLLTAIWCMVTRGEIFRHAQPKLTESKIQRREQRLKAAPVNRGGA